MLYFLTIVIIAPNSYASEYEPTPTEIARQYGYPNVTDAYQPEGSINVSQTGQILYDYQSNQKWYPFNDEANDNVSYT